jgi:hypothetical protein
MAAEVQNMIKINNLTSEIGEILGSRSGSLGVTQTTKPHQQSNSKVVAATQREASCAAANIVCAEPKVISCNYKKQQPRFDYSSIQALMTNLKQTSSGSTQASSGSMPPKQYARSTSRGKDTGLAQVNKLTALLGKPLSMAGRNSQVNGSSSGGAVGLASHSGLPMNAFHPRP